MPIVDAALERAAAHGRRGRRHHRCGRRIDAARRRARCDEAVEIARVVPVIEGIAAVLDVAISIDTQQARGHGRSGRGRRLHRQRCARAAGAAGARAWRRSIRSRRVPDAHAGRAAYDAGRSAL